MRRILRFFHFTYQDQLLLLKSVVLLVAIGAGLKLLPFQTLRRLLMLVTPTVDSRREADPKLILRISWAIETISQYLPSLTCLPKALTTHLLLSRIGQPASLRIGVAKSLEGKLQAHAWVESNGCIVIGKISTLDRYTVLPPLENKL